MSDYAKYDSDGRILFCGQVPEGMLQLQGDNVYIGKTNPDTQYILDGELCTYTEEEQQAKDTLPLGWVWKLPERIGVDPRKAAQKKQDAIDEVSRNRANSYPPLSDLADALYWQSKGDESKMTTYLAACEAVKNKFPKIR